MRRPYHTAVVLLLSCACTASPAPEPAPSPPGSATAADSSLIRVDQATKRRDALEVSVARAAQSVPEVDGYGRVLDPGPFVQAATNLEAARSAAETAEHELRRVEELEREAQNASVRQVEAARAAAARARADLEMATAQLATAFGPTLARDARLPELTRRLGQREEVLVRIDVPGSGAPPRPERGARLVAFSRSEADLNAVFLGEASDSNLMLPGWSYLFLVAHDPPTVGTPVRATLRGAGEVEAGATVSADALVRHGDQVFLFVERDSHEFERRLVAARLQADGTAFVSTGLEPGEKVVTEGAHALLSADLLAEGRTPAGTAANPPPEPSPGHASTPR